jgi:hypothetical protein
VLCNSKKMPCSRSCFGTGARRAGSPHGCPTRSSHSVFTASSATSHRQRYLTRLLESNRKSIRIAPAQDTGDPLHAAFEIVQQLALHGHPVPLKLLLLRKAFLTLDGITCQLDPDFNAWLETLAHVSVVCASEPSCEPGAFNSRGSAGPISIVPGSTRPLAAHFAGTTPKFVRMQKIVGGFRKSVRRSIRKLRNHPEPSQRREIRKKHE